MKEGKIISKLSELPVKELNDIRMMAAILRNQEQSERFNLWVERCNIALDLKQAERLNSYEDTQFTFV